MINVHLPEDGNAVVGDGDVSVSNDFIHALRDKGEAQDFRVELKVRLEL